MIMRACEEVCTRLGGNDSGSGDNHDVDRTIPRWRRSQLLTQDGPAEYSARYGCLVQLR